VIPLRPLGAGEILDGSISTGRKHWRTVLPLSLAVAVLSQGTLTTFDWFSRNDSHSNTAMALLGVGFLISALCGLVLTALLTMVVSKAILGEPVTAGSAWRAARPQLWRLLGLTLLVGLICVGIALAGLLPAIIVALAGDTGSPNNGLDVLAFFGFLAGFGTTIWMYIKLSLAAPALMLEKQGIKAALARSRKLTRGSWWRIFGITLLGMILSAILNLIIAVPFTVIAGTSGSSPFGSPASGTVQPMSFAALLVIAIGGVLGATLTAPVQSGINVLLYVDQRIRREALDLELARAAGLPEYGGTGWAGQSNRPPTGAA
jgi:MFS family permease